MKTKNPETNKRLAWNVITVVIGPFRVHVYANGACSEFDADPDEMIAAFDAANLGGSYVRGCLEEARHVENWVRFATDDGPARRVFGTWVASVARLAGREIDTVAFWKSAAYHQKGRLLPEQEIDIRSEYQRDRGRLFQAMEEAGLPIECVACGDRSDVSIDHIMPLSRGGTNDLENLQFLCRRCNASKGNRIPEQVA